MDVILNYNDVIIINLGKLIHLIMNYMVKLEHIDTRIKRRGLQFAGHCYRSNEHYKQFVSELLFYV